jgi:hypothetical protein
MESDFCAKFVLAIRGGTFLAAMTGAVSLQMRGTANADTTEGLRSNAPTSFLSPTRRKLTAGPTINPFSVGYREAVSGIPTAQGGESGASLLSYEASPRNAKTSDRIPRQTQRAAAI